MPAIAPPFKMNVAVVIVPAFIASEKVAEMAEFIAMPVAPAAGIVDDTVGTVVSGAGGEPPPPPHPERITAIKIGKVAKINFMRLRIFISLAP